MKYDLIDADSRDIDYLKKAKLYMKNIAKKVYKCYNSTKDSVK